MLHPYGSKIEKVPRGIRGEKSSKRHGKFEEFEASSGQNAEGVQNDNQKGTRDQDPIASKDI